MLLRQEEPANRSYCGMQTYMHNECNQHLLSILGRMLWAMRSTGKMWKSWMQHKAHKRVRWRSLCTAGYPPNRLSWRTKMRGECFRYWGPEPSWIWKGEKCWDLILHELEDPPSTSCCHGWADTNTLLVLTEHLILCQCRRLQSGYL